MTQRRLRIARDPDARKRLADVPETDGVRAIVRVRLTPSASKQNFEEYLRTLPPVLCAWHLTGDADYEVLVACPAIADLGSVLACLRGCGGTEVSSAGLVLHEVPGLGAARLPAQPIAGTEMDEPARAADGAVSLLARRQPGQRTAATGQRNSGRTPRSLTRAKAR